MDGHDVWGVCFLVAIYGLLATLSFIGAVAWDSYFMWGLGVVWMVMGVVIAAYFIDRLPDFPDDDNPL